VRELLSYLQTAVDGNQAEMKKLNRKIKQREEAIKRLKHKDGEANSVAALLRADIARQNANIEMIKQKIAVIEEMKAVLDEYTYTADLQEIRTPKTRDEILMRAMFASFGGRF
jgi:septal ring factor EnvC (AmiA/AmiB activator)